VADQEDDDERPDPKKERVLHTRVPAVLEQELKRLAKNLRVPVSNVVRSILEDALQTMESVGRKAEGELHHATERLAKQRENIRRRMEEDEEIADAEVVETEPPGDPLEGVLGFTPIVLARPARCAVSGREIKAGEEALTGIDERTDRRVIVAKDVLDRLGRERKEES
jgi:hypothetical protein